SSISSSLTAMAVPPEARTAASTRKSPSGLGTRKPAASVWAPSKKRLRGSFSSKGRTTGAQPSACTAIIFGRRPPIQPSFSISSNAFHMPIMPTPPPVGQKIASGSSQPICSATSYPIVFLPSMRDGSLSVLTSNQPSFGPCSATIRPQSEINPSTSVTCAPYALHSRELGFGTSRGMNMCASIPPPAAYAAPALAALPAEGMSTFRMPSSTHMETAQARPRALNEAVGLSPSSFTQSCSAPMRVPSLLVRTSGVQPSPRVTTLASAGGSTGAYRHMFAGPLATSRRGQRYRMTERSYRTSNGPPHVQRLATARASNLAPQRLHSRWVALGIQLQSNIWLLTCQCPTPLEST